jgi:hypothetical protein
MENLKVVYLSCLYHAAPDDVLAQHDQKLLNWLSPLEPSERHDDVSSKRLPESGTWMLQHDSYLAWLSESPTNLALCCYGDPGAGKTFIAYVNKSA